MFFLKFKYYKSKFTKTCMSSKKLLPFFTKTKFSSFCFNDILRMLNVYKTIVKDQEALDSWATDEISVAEISFWKYLEYIPVILRNCKKNKEEKNCRIYNFSFFKCLLNLRDNCRIIFRKGNNCPLNIRFTYQILYRVQHTSP